MDLHSLQDRARSSLWLALAEFAAVAGLFYPDVHHTSMSARPPTYSCRDGASLRLRGHEGQSKLFLIYFVLVWTLGALGEEIVYRGYLMNRGGRNISQYEGILDIELDRS